MTAVMLGIVAAGLLAVRKWGERLPVRGGMRLVVLAAALTQRSVIVYLTAEEPFGSGFLLSVAGGCLLLASVTDHETCQVYQFTWWPICMAVLPSLLRMGGEIVLPLAVFIFLQFAVFGRLYGKADCHAFCVCAAVQAARGGGFSGFLIHMLFAWLLLVLVQAARGNIGRNGNLKKPVPFLPYITVAFWLALIWGS